MRKIANEKEKNRRELFENTAAKKGMHVAIIEKDFWVCYMLEYLFQRNKYREHIVFKGGTSLSKAYGVIERFSEDIDIILDWELLGYADKDLWAERSNNKQYKLNTEVNEKAAQFIANEFLDSIRQDIKKELNFDFRIYVDTHDIMTINFEYPHSFDDEYVRPIVRLEIGPLAAWIPTTEKAIQPYCAEEYPQLFSTKSIDVMAVKIERTFWEKVTILHKEACKKVDQTLSPRYSRHYYDVYMLCKAGIKDVAVNNLALLRDVVIFKDKFYHSGNAHYEDILRGSIHLVPPEHIRNGLKKDYDSMANMIYGEQPTFEELMLCIEQLESELNTAIVNINKN